MAFDKPLHILIAFRRAVQIDQSVTDTWVIMR
jgi:hypothetical protein